MFINYAAKTTLTLVFADCLKILKHVLAVMMIFFNKFTKPLNILWSAKWSKIPLLLHLICL